MSSVKKKVYSLATVDRFQLVIADSSHRRCTVFLEPCSPSCLRLTAHRATSAGNYLHFYDLYWYPTNKRVSSQWQGAVKNRFMSIAEKIICRKKLLHKWEECVFCCGCLIRGSDRKPALVFSPDLGMECSGLVCEVWEGEVRVNKTILTSILGLINISEADVSLLYSRTVVKNI